MLGCYCYCDATAARVLLRRYPSNASVMTLAAIDAAAAINVAAAAAAVDAATATAARNATAVFSLPSMPLPLPLLLLSLPPLSLLCLIDWGHQKMGEWHAFVLCSILTYLNGSTLDVVVWRQIRNL